MDDRFQFYRQPMVTAICIFLGFLLNFATKWITSAFATERVKDSIIASGLCVCITLLLVVLYRILNMHYPKEKAESYYKKTLQLFITGIGIIFLAIIAVMVESYALNLK